MAFTRAELATYNGIGGNPAYVAFEGRVYDVSPSYQNTGLANIPAGTDLTDRLELKEEIRNLLEQAIVVGGLSDG